MRKFGVRLGITMVIALVATVGVLGNSADARARRHHRYHHHAGGGDGGGTPTSTAASPCSAIPNPVVLNLTGNFVFTIQCHGLSPAEPLGIDSFLIRNNCVGATNFPLAGTADLNGNYNSPVLGSGCLPGAYSIQLVGSFSTTEFPVTFTF